MPETEENHHYHHIQGIQSRLDEHSWSRQQTRYDSVFIAWLHKEMQNISNEAYQLTQKNSGYCGPLNDE